MTTGNLPRKLQLQIWRRDKFRCQDCGVAVGGTGCKPQTHHVVPRSRGGTDQPENLVTLCFPCHCLRASAGHYALLANRTREESVDFVKWLTWELATNLLGLAEWMNPRRFPADQVVSDLRGWRDTLNKIIEEAEVVGREGSKHLVRHAALSSDPSDGNRRVDAVLEGVRIAWFSDIIEGYLDGELRDSRRRWRLPDPHRDE